MTDDELEKLLQEIESDRVERKSALSDPDRVRQAICAFANDLPNHGKPGVVFIGVDDSGKCADLAITDDLLLKIADMKTDGNILPLPSMTVEKRTLRGCEIAVVIVQPADAPPVRFRGRICIRTGPRRGIATAQDERILNEKRRFRDLSFDLHPVSHATLPDLDSRRFEEEYLPGAVAPDVLEANERSYEQRLAACKMIRSTDEPIPTVLGCLVLGKRTRDLVPGAYVQFLRIDGESLVDPIKDEDEISGPLSSLLRRIDEKLEIHIQATVDFTSGVTEKRKPEYPIVALQQLVRNAIMHRTYEATHAPVRINWFNDRIEIQNPGGPFGQVTRTNFGEPGVTDYRNPNLAEALKVLGFVQRFGVGIQIARDQLRRNGNPPPAFTVEDAKIHVEIRKVP